MKAIIPAALLTLLISCASQAPTEQHAGAASTSTNGPVADHKPTGNPRIVILFMSDLHGHLRADTEASGYARLATVIAKEKAAAGEKTDVYVVLGGDAAGKSALPCRKSNEKACFPLLKDMGVDLAVLGNGELKRSAQELNDLIQASGVKWLGSNVKSSGPQAAWSDSVVFAGPRSGLKLGFASWTVAPAPGEVDMKKNKISVDAAMSAATFAKWAKTFNGVPTFWVSHEMMAQDKAALASYCAKPSEKLLAVLKAHDHESQDDKSTCAPILEPGPYGRRVLRVVVEPNKENVVAMAGYEFIDVDDKVAEDGAMKGKIDGLYSQLAPDAGRKVASVSKQLSNADFAKWAATAFKSVTKADLAIVNSGAVKSGAPAGDLSIEQLGFIYPYQDELMGLDVPTKALETALCNSAKRTHDGYLDNGSDLYFSGADLQNAGTPNCKLNVTPKRASVKLVMPKYLMARSGRWLGTDLQGRMFKYGIDTSRAFELHLKRTGGTL